MAASSSIPVPITPRMDEWPGSARMIATATPMGSAMTSEMREEATVPKMAGRAPKASIGGFHSRPTRNPRPKRRRAGSEPCVSTRTKRTSTSGAAPATIAVIVLNRSGGRLVSVMLAVSVAAAVPIPLPGAAGGRAVAVEPVADAAYGHDLERRDIRELFAQPPHVHVNRLAVARKLVTPDVFEEDVTRVDAARKCKQVREQLELACGELDVSPVEDNPARGAVDAEAADGVELGCRPRLVGIWRGSSQDGVDAREHLTD